MVIQVFHGYAGFCWLCRFLVVMQVSLGYAGLLWLCRFLLVIQVPPGLLGRRGCQQVVTKLVFSYNPQYCCGSWRTFCRQCSLLPLLLIFRRNVIRSIAQLLIMSSAFSELFFVTAFCVELFTCYSRCSMLQTGSRLHAVDVELSLGVVMKPVLRSTPLVTD